tara:strand:- start:485 stop:1156 length:672 start_codon:yes stop_codon:yes gene_type:complete
MSELFKIFIVGIYLFLVYKFRNNTKLLLLFTLATLLILCNINKLYEGYNNSYDSYSPAKFGDNMNSAESNDNDNVKTDKKNDDDDDDDDDDKMFVSNNIIPRAAFTQYQMGPFDNLVLTTGNPKSEYLKLVNDSLSKEEDICIYQGNENPLKCKKTTGLNIGPPVDGINGSPQSMFMFANNKSSPDCCPSTFSTSTGCVCTTEAQRKFVASNRGMVSKPVKSK